MKKKRSTKGISAFKKKEEKPVNIIIEKTDAEKKDKIRMDSIKTEEKHSRDNNERDIKFQKIVEPQIQKIIKPTLKLLKNDFDLADDKISFLKENFKKINELNKRNKTIFINHIKNVYTN
jgi:hypothetical protein